MLTSDQIVDLTWLNNQSVGEVVDPISEFSFFVLKEFPNLKRAAASFNTDQIEMVRTYVITVEFDHLLPSGWALEVDTYQMEFCGR
jgi:hypothetical protein